MTKSRCCNANLVKGEYVDSFHGSDDGYELKIPCYICEKCKKVEHEFQIKTSNVYEPFAS